MTTLEIILIIILVYFVIAYIFSFLSAINCGLLDTEDLICSLLWIIFLPYALYRRFILKK